MAAWQLKLEISYNSQAVEQNNRVLKRLVSSVSYMSPSNFKMVVTIFMAAQNFIRLNTMDEEWDVLKSLLLITLIL